MNIDKIRTHLNNLNFKDLFIQELGWDRHDGTLGIQLDGTTYTLRAIAQKRGVQIFECPAPENGKIPDYATRKKIERQVTKSAYEHLVIYTDPEKTQQIWQWVARESGKPAAYREYPIYKGQSGDIIIQKLQSIIFPLDEEEALTVTGVVFRLKDAFDKDRVTKKFYDLFKKEHGGFLKFIQGLPDENLERWYASVMINRLMFIYFIQKKGFLNSDPDYLQTELKKSKQRGKDRYYKDFLCPLFFKGFAIKEDERSQKINQLLGKIPYLNGGLFLKHQIEEHHGKTIDFPDKAFDKLFGFFDQYEWHLDDRPIAKGNEINPDVLGYIFEKYINQKELGAYYTKEDITGYISKNTIIPYLFDSARKECKIAFEGEHSVWQLLKADPDRYIYEAFRRGVILEESSILPESELPDFVQKGMHDPKERMFDKRYNLGEAQLYDGNGKKLTLPTETWREYVDRRKRCIELREKPQAGEVQDINDLITYNLNITQFAQDVIDNCEGPDLLNAFWKAISKITILDPTGGSGAFLFAALNILEPLYEACLQRMEAFINEWGESGKKRHPNYHKFFSETLKRVDEHPNRKYFIYKSIIINNLFAVDILEEAVEICKLRLFLKLVAQVEPGEIIEALPDIDFNIRAGNTLVGYATYDEVEKAVTSKLDFDNAMQRIEEKAEDIDRLFSLFRQQQTELGGEVTPEDKEELRNRLKALEDELNQYLAVEYGVDLKNKEEYHKWLFSHKPFHWFIEFYGIMKNGGFGVIIGNPPFVELPKIRSNYIVLEYSTMQVNNLFALVAERSKSLIQSTGRIGIILPNSSVSAIKMASLQSLMRKKALCWISNFAWRPSKLFEGANMLLAIWIIHNGDMEACYSTRYNRWTREFREFIFPSLTYAEITNVLRETRIPKSPGVIAHSILNKCMRVANNKILLHRMNYSKGKYSLYYFRAVLYWVKVLTNPPISREDGKNVRTGEMKEVVFESRTTRDVVVTLLSSNLFSLYYTIWSSCQVINSTDFEFQVDLEKLENRHGKELTKLASRFIEHLQSNSIIQRRKYSARGRKFVMEKQYFFVKLSKSIIDEIDRVLGQYYGFTDEELDFIINYDIKYRMGRDAGEEE